MSRPKAIIIASAIGILFFVLFSSIQVGATHVEIDANLSVSPGIISFETVFPGEVHFKPLDIDLSRAFMGSSVHDDVEYRILQRSKPKMDSDAERAYCAQNPTDYTRCYPSLCPYLSKEPDGTPANDTGVSAFHDPWADSSIARGRLAKSDNDVRDHWTVDLHVPCFRGECDQASEIPHEYQLDPSLNGEKFGCDLVVEVTDVSFNECREDRIPTPTCGIINDPEPLHVDNYSDFGVCNFITTHDVIIEGPVVFPNTCTAGANITARTIMETPAGSVAFNRSDGILRLESKNMGVTLNGRVESLSRDQIRIFSNADMLIENAFVRNANNNGDLYLKARENVLVASSTLVVGPLAPATTGGDELKIECTNGLCGIQFFDARVYARVLNMTAFGDIRIHNTKLIGRDPLGNYKIESYRGKVDLSGGKCERPDTITNNTEGNLTIIARTDAVLDDIFIRIPEHIKVTAGNIISMLRADISNDFGGAGDITMRAGLGLKNIYFQDIKLVDDNGALHSFSTLNGGDNPAPAQRASHHVLGTPLLDN